MNMYPIYLYNYYLWNAFYEEQWFNYKVSEYIDKNKWLFEDFEDDEEFFDCKSSVSSSETNTTESELEKLNQSIL